MSTIPSTPPLHAHPYATTEYDLKNEERWADHYRTLQKINFIGGSIIGVLGALYLASSFGLPVVGLLFSAVILAVGLNTWDHLASLIAVHEQQASFAKIRKQLHKKWDYPWLRARYIHYRAEMKRHREDRHKHEIAFAASLQTESSQAMQKKTPKLKATHEEILQTQKAIFTFKQKEAIARLEMAWILFLEEQPRCDLPQKHYFVYNTKNFQEFTADKFLDQTHDSLLFDYFVKFQGARPDEEPEYMSLDEVLKVKIKELKDKNYPNHARARSVFPMDKSANLIADEPITPPPSKFSSPSAPNTVQRAKGTHRPIPYSLLDDP